MQIMCCIFYIFFNLTYFFRDPQKQSDILLDSDFGITSDGVNIIIAEDITPGKMYLCLSLDSNYFGKFVFGNM